MVPLDNWLASCFKDDQRTRTIWDATAGNNNDGKNIIGVDSRHVDELRALKAGFNGTIKELHYEENDVAVVGKPLLDIDMDVDADDEKLTVTQAGETVELQSAAKGSEKGETLIRLDEDAESRAVQKPQTQPPISPEANSNFEATPAVRHLLKQHNIAVKNITATGGGGRITKEDVERYLADSREEAPAPTPSSTAASVPSTVGQDVTIRLSPMENQMFKAMTRSLSIPHFLYTHSVNVSAFSELRSKLATSKVLEHIMGSAKDTNPILKITLLPFVMKALSRVFLQFPKLNSHADATEPNTPKLTLKAGHNLGMAMDTPQGLLVPVIKNVQNHSILSLAAEIKRVSDVARAGKLKPEDFQGATFTVSNIGSVGAGCQAVSPVIVAPMVGILAVGRMSDVPVLGKMIKETRDS